MNNTRKVHRLAAGAVIAALYVAITFCQEMIFPGTTSMAVQFRLSEVLTVLALFTPAAIPGLTVGCIIANLTALGALPMDIVMGSFATFLAVTSMYKLREVKVFSLPIASLLMPAVFNGIIIGLEIEIFFIDGPFNLVSFLTQGLLVAAGEAVVLLLPGVIFYKSIKSKQLEKYLNNI